MSRSRLDQTLDAIDEGLLDVGKQSSEEWGMPLSRVRPPSRTTPTVADWDYQSEPSILGDPLYASVAYIFDPLNRTGHPLVFHAEGGVRWNAELQEHVTPCGLVTFRWRRGNDSNSAETLAVRLLREHAELFARPCRRCHRATQEGKPS